MTTDRDDLMNPPQNRASRRGFLQASGLVALALSGCAPTLSDDDDSAGDDDDDDDSAGDDDDATGDDDDDSAASCSVTEDNIEGPFYREDAPFRGDLNATGTEGISLQISGQVLGPDCTPLAGAIVDIWHADPDGEYDNSTADFDFRGRVEADAEGRYAYTTLLMGRYPNNGTYRPRHIHYRVSAAGHRTLVTQLYFTGDEFIEGDPFVEKELITDLTGSDDSGYTGTFDIVLDWA